MIGALALALLAPAVSGPRPDESGYSFAVDAERQAAVGAVLTGEGSPEGLAQGLIELGPAHVAEVFAVLVDGRAVLEEDGVRRPVSLPPRLATPVRLALAAGPQEELRGFLLGLATGTPTAAERSTALDVVGGVGAREDLGLLVELAEPAAGQARVDRSVRGAFEQGLERLTARHAITPRELARACLEAHPSVIGGLLGALGRGEPRQAAGELAGLLGRIPEADGLLLSQLDSIGSRLQAPVAQDVAHAARGYLSSVRPELVLGAVAVAGSLRDMAAIPDLVGLVGDPQAGRRAAEVLTSLCGKRFGTAQEWEEWYAGELTWLEREAPARLAQLELGTPAEVARILTELAGKRHFRDHVDLAVAGVLARPEEDLVRLACSLLGHLRSARVTPELEGLAGHPSVVVRTEAARALDSIRTQAGGPKPRRNLNLRR